jgi:hypothetical protein
MNRIKYLNRVILTIVFFAIIITSCKKTTNPAITAPKNTNAIIIYTGEVAADGCGWLVKINDTGEEYSPVNLSPAFQKDSLKVNITFSVLTTKFACGSLANNPGITQIQIGSISK